MITGGAEVCVKKKRGVLKRRGRGILEKGEEKREKRREDDMGVQKRGDGWMGGWME